jgi:hypothetical protein
MLCWPHLVGLGNMMVMTNVDTMISSVREGPGQEYQKPASVL